MTVSDARAWLRYGNEPEALLAIVHLNNQSKRRDPANALWYAEQNAAIEAHLRRTQL